LGETNINYSLKTFCHKHKKPGLVVILSDFMDEKGFKEGLRYLKQNNWQVFLIHTLAQEEINPELEGELFLIDLETNQGKEIIINQQTIENYLRLLEKFCDNLRLFANKYGIKYFKASTDIKYEDFIYDNLRGRGGVK
jgi:hypothetical protein